MVSSYQLSANTFVLAVNVTPPLKPQNLLLPMYFRVRRIVVSLLTNNYQLCANICVWVQSTLGSQCDTSY